MVRQYVLHELCHCIERIEHLSTISSSYVLFSVTVYLLRACVRLLCERKRYTNLVWLTGTEGHGKVYEVVAHLDVRTRKSQWMRLILLHRN